jgi:two-component system phosphate regulon sensor histidine kinase PhoR
MSLKWRIALPHLLLIALSISLLYLFRDNSLAWVLGGIAMAIIVYFIAALLNRQVARPIEGLRRRCRRIAEGEFDYQPGLGETEEIAGLSWELEQMSQRLQQRFRSLSQEQYKTAAILSQMDDGVIVADEAATVRMINPAAEKLFHIASIKALEHPFIEVVRDHELNQLLRQCLRSRSQQMRFFELGREKKLVRVITTPLRGDGQIGGLVVFQDMSELQQLEKSRRELVSNISHELGTPIASVKAIIETLQGGAIDDPIATELFLSKAESEMNRLTQLVQKFGELSRFDSGGVSLEIAQCSIGQLIQQTVERFQAQADRAGLNLTLEFSEDLPLVSADKAEIEKVMVNLLHNAIKFTPPEGQVIIRAEAEKDKVVVSVADTGVGIPAEHLPHIFERFYKADQSRSSEGIGLGLAIAKHIIQTHHGEIWVESQEGKGTTLSFSLPSPHSEPR